MHRRLFAWLTCALIACSAGPALATLDQTLAPFPDDTPMLLTISLDPGHWPWLLHKLEAGNLSLKTEFSSPDGSRQTFDQALPPDLVSLIDFLHKDLRFDPVRDGLMNLGSHLSLAYRHEPDMPGDLLFSLNLRSHEQAEALVAGLQTRMQDKLARQTFGPYKLYTFPSPDRGHGLGQLHLAVSQNNLIGSLGDSDALLKRMLYLDTVLSPASSYRLSNQQGFRAVRQHLDRQPAWAYFDTRKSLRAAGIKAPVDLADLLALGQSVGIGIELGAQKVSFSSFLAPDWTQLTPAQKDYLTAMQTKPDQELTALIEALPADPVFLTAGQGLDTLLNQGLPVPSPEGPPTDDSLRNGIKAVFNLDYRQDLLPLLDGRYGLGLFAGKPADNLPGAVIYLGVKDGQEASLDKLMQQQFRFRTVQADMLRTHTSVEANLHLMQSVVETFAIDWGGVYPTDLSTLMREAQTEGRAYWNPFRNPLSGGTGAGKSVADYVQFSGTAEQAGQVFYEPVGTVTREGRTFATGFRLYGYDPDGTLYRLNAENAEASDGGLTVVRQDLPKVLLPFEQPGRAESPDTVLPQLLETYQGTPIYGLPLKAYVEDLEERFAQSTYLPHLYGSDMPKRSFPDSLVLGLLSRLNNPAYDSQTQATLVNLKALKACAESYAAAHDGLFAGDLPALRQGAAKDHCPTLVNPVTGGEGFGGGLEEMRAGYRAVDKAGLVYYVPSWDDVGSGARRYTDYTVYAFGTDGWLYSLGHQRGTDSDSYVVLRDLPVSKAYSPAPPPARTLAFARRGRLMMLASDPQTLKAALAGGSSPSLERRLQAAGATGPNGLFLLDLQAAIGLIRNYLPDDVLEYKEYTRLEAALAPWHAVLASSRQHPQVGSEQHLTLEVDLDQALQTLSQSEPEAQTDLNADVKLRMHVLQSLVEIYAINKDGLYPPDLAGLAAEVPMTSQESAARGKMDYRDYQPGPTSANLVLYEPVTDEEGQITRYRIYGTDAAGQLILDQGKPFTISIE